MVDPLDDQYSDYFMPDELKEFQMITSASVWSFERRRKEGFLKFDITREII